MSTKSLNEQLKGYQSRDFSLVKQPDNDDKFLEFSFSSEKPVEKWWGYQEILSHEPNSINLERLNGMTFLWNHDWDKILGKVVDISLKDKRLYAKIQWSNNAFAQEKKQDVIDGILSNASFMYTIEKYETDEENETITATRWTIYEVSLVSIPADHTVGIGRSITPTIMTKTANEPDLTQQTRETELNRIRTIQGMAKQHGFPELADELIESGVSVSEAQNRYLSELASQRQSGLAKPVDPLGLSEKEQKSYSMLRAIQATLTGDWKDAGFEQECSAELAKRSGRSLSGQGFFMPVRDLKIDDQQVQVRAPYAVGADATGGFTVETELLAENFIDALRNKAVIFQMGAQMLSGLQGDVDIPGQDAVTNTYWVAENGPVTQTEATFRQVQLRPKTIGTLSLFSRLTLLQSSIDIEQFIRRDFAAQIALGIDLAAIAGTGLSNQPLGILNTAGIGSVELGTNGAAPTWDDIVGLETEVTIDNADVNTCHYLTNAATKGKLKRTQKFAGTNGDPIWENDGMNGMMNGYLAWCSNQMPSDLTKGSGTNLSALLFGDFSQLICGEWGVLEVLVNPYSVLAYPSGAVQIRALQTIDIALRYAQSFSAITDAVTI